ENKFIKTVNKWGSTTHLSVIDGEGNAASVTTSNGEGSGYVIPGTGIMVNNMLGEEDLNPQGFHQWQENVRISSMMSPTIVLNNNQLVRCQEKNIFFGGVHTVMESPEGLIEGAGDGRRDGVVASC